MSCGNSDKEEDMEGVVQLELQKVTYHTAKGTQHNLKPVPDNLQRRELYIHNANYVAELQVSEEKPQLNHMLGKQAEETQLRTQCCNESELLTPEEKKHITKESGHNEAPQQELQSSQHVQLMSVDDQHRVEISLITNRMMGNS